MSPRARSGFTLVEMVVALTVVSLVLGAVSATVIATQREFVRQRQTVQAEETIRSLEVFVARLLRNGRADPRSAGSTVAKINFNPQGHTTWDNVRVRSDFNTADGSVTGNLEDVLLDKVADTVFVRWRSGAAVQRFAYPVKLLRFDGYRLDGTAVTDTAQSDLVRKVRLTIEVPVSSSSTDVLRRERWVFLRN